MAKNLNDNIRIKAGKPLDAKYLNTTNTGYLSASAANTAIPISERHVGLTVLINNIEYWYKDGVANSNLVEKNNVLTNYISGATNLGYFSGYDGIQTLPLNHSTDNSFDGDYISLYNNYYRGSDGIIHIGTPSDGINKRAYLKSTSTVRSFIWNEYVAGADLLGWIFVDGDVSEKVGTFVNSSTVHYYNTTTTFPYINTYWTAGNSYNNSSNLIVDTVEGILTTGNTLTVGVRPYSYTEDKELKFKSLVSSTPSIINFTEDEAFIYVNITLTGKTNQTDFESHTGNTNLHYEMSGITGFTSTNDFNNYTGNTLSTITGITESILLKADKLKNIVLLTGSTTLNSSHNGKIIECNGTFTITLPNGLSDGFNVTIVNLGSGTITLLAITILQSIGNLLATQYTEAKVYHRGGNIWVATGSNLTT